MPLLSRYRDPNEKELKVDSSRTLNWSVPIEHVAGKVLRVQLVASLRRVKGLDVSGGVYICPRCLIDCWVESEHGEKLAQSTGSICRKNLYQAVHVHWLGRARTIPDLPPGWQLVGPGAGSPLLSQRAPHAPASPQERLAGLARTSSNGSLPGLRRRGLAPISPKVASSPLVRPASRARRLPSKGGSLPDLGSRPCSAAWARTRGPGDPGSPMKEGALPEMVEARSASSYKQTRPFLTESSTCPQEQRTLAQAVLGVLGCVAQLFGVRKAQLDAEDNGSGKLIKYYERLGFVPQQRHCIQKDLPMSASIQALAKLAPVMWMDDMPVPSGFEAPFWLWSQVSGLGIDQLFTCLSIPRILTWPAEIPEQGLVKVTLSILSSSRKIDAEVAVLDAYGTELAVIRGALRMQMKSLRVIWLGRSRSQPVHPMLAGKALYPTAARPDGVTTAAALLGAAASLALSFGCPQVEITACDNGSRRLLRYLRELGFTNGDDPIAGDPSAFNMAGQSATLAERCCPSAWVPELLSRDAYGFIAAIVAW